MSSLVGLSTHAQSDQLLTSKWFCHFYLNVVNALSHSSDASECFSFALKVNPSQFFVFVCNLPEGDVNPVSQKDIMGGG